MKPTAFSFVSAVQAQLYQVYSDPNMGRSPPATHLRKVTGSILDLFEGLLYPTLLELVLNHTLLWGMQGCLFRKKTKSPITLHDSAIPQQKTSIIGRHIPHLALSAGISICALIKRPIGALVGRDWMSDWLTAGVCPPPLLSSLIPVLTTGERTNHKIPARSSKSTQVRDN